MADLFISYAREDREAVRAVHDALEKRGKHSWVDWEGIEPSDKWMQSIREAIDAADAFVVFMSPGSLASPVCRLEVEHAASQNKRLLPVVIAPIEDGQAPEPLAELNWVFLKPTDDFDAGIEALTRAMEVDLDLIRLHTRVLTRAAAWDASHRQTSSLLRGDELKQAEAWLARAASGARPQPTQLQAEFVHESRRRSNRQQRATVIGSLAVAGVAIALAVFAVIQRDQARRQAHLAMSRQLAANAVTNLQTRSALPLLLGVEASRMAPTDEARDSLLSAIQIGLNPRLEVEAGPVNSVAFSPDGKLLATGNGQRFDEGERAGSVTIWDVATRTQQGSPFAIQGSVWSVAFSPDGRTLAASNFVGTYSLWDVATRRSVGSTPGGFPVVIAVAFSPDGRAIAAGYADGSVTMFDGATGTQLRALAGSSSDLGATESVAFSPDGSILAAGARSGRITLWDAASGRQLGDPLDAQSGPASSLAFTPDGMTLVEGTGGGDSGAPGSVIRWDVATHAQITPALAPVEEASVSAVDAVAVSPDGRRIASGNSDGSVSLWDSATGQLLGSPFDGAGEAFSVAFSPDGQTLASGNADGSVTLWDVSLRDSIGSARGQGDRLFGAGPAGNGSSLTLVRSDKSIVRWDLASHPPLGPPVPGWDALGVAISPDGQTLAVGDLELPGRLILTDAASPQASPRVLETGRYAMGVAFSGDGRTLASGSDDGQITLWDVHSGARSGSPFGASTGGVPGLAFSPDDRMLAAGSTDGVIRFWDVQTHRQVGTVIRIHGGYVVSVAYSPDGTTLAAGARDGTVTLWDVPTRSRLGSPLAGLTHAVMTLGFSRDGRLLTSLDSRGTIIRWPQAVWTRDLEALSATACQLAGRSMTQAEWSRFLPEQPFDPVCPAPRSPG